MFLKSWGSNSDHRGAKKKFVGEAFHVVGDVGEDKKCGELEKSWGS